ncbi:hypothetical protein HDU80_006440 [Chytriomyces hyalinus]|nr:hypothetical protein HDU80_006440 [Chytriomyces hyalinus]
MLKNLVQQYEGRIGQSKRFQSTGKKLVNALIGGSSASPVTSKPQQSNPKALGQSQAPQPKPALKRSSAILRPTTSSSLKTTITTAAAAEDGGSDQLFQVRRDSADTINSTRTSTDSAIEISDKLPEVQFVEQVEPTLVQVEPLSEQQEPVFEVSTQVESAPEQVFQQAVQQPPEQPSSSSPQRALEQAPEHAEQVRIPTRRDSAFIPAAVSDDTARGVEIMRAKSIKRMSMAAKQRRVSVLMKPASIQQQHHHNHQASSSSNSTHSTISDDFASAILSATDTIFVENKMKGIQKFKRSMSSDETHVSPNDNDKQQQSPHPQGVARSISMGKNPVKKPLPPMPEKQLPPISNAAACENTANMFDAAAELNRIRIEQILIQVELRDRLTLLRKSIESLNSKHDNMSARLCATYAVV